MMTSTPPLQTLPNARASSNETFFQSLAERVGDVICYVGPIGNVVYISPAVERLLGYKPEDLVGRHILFTVVEEDRQAILDAAAHLQAGEVEEIRTQARRRRADGSIVWIESVSRAAPEGGGSVILVLRDITERKQLEEILAKHAMQDGLTGLANRRCFDQTLEREWRLAIGEKSEMALLLIDIDHFKRFNDGYGHQVGDDCLRSVAIAIQSHMRSPRDLACRYGGEEIAVILGGTGSAAALQIAQRLCASVEALAIPHAHGFSEPVLTVSIGAATALARDGGTVQMPHGLLQAADHALYRAKSEGRNRVAQSLLFAPHES
ncbi:MAG: diguanylate cyclase [Pseudomonadota bacterium]|nr:diguanylate cyclase [Pseudomonadota bacterium]